MEKNVGTLDRVIRIAIGLGIISMAFAGPQTPFAYFGLVPLLTGIIGWCPPYAMFGISTCEKCQTRTK